MNSKSALIFLSAAVATILFVNAGPNSHEDQVPTQLRAPLRQLRTDLQSMRASTSLTSAMVSTLVADLQAVNTALNTVPSATQYATQISALITTIQQAPLNSDPKALLNQIEQTKRQIWISAKASNATTSG